MNTADIAKSVAEMLPDAIGVHITDQGGGIFALHCNIGGMARCVQFSAAGLYGEHRLGLWAETPKSEQHLAGEIVKELRK